MSERDGNGQRDAFAESLSNVKTAFAWADSHARLGDYEYALKWLDVGERLSDNKPARVDAKRKRWTRELNKQLERA